MTALVVTPPAVRALKSGLSEAVAAAVIEFLTGALISDQRRVGKPPDAATLQASNPPGGAPPCCSGSMTQPVRSSCCAAITAATPTDPTNLPLSASRAHSGRHHCAQMEARQHQKRVASNAEVLVKRRVRCRLWLLSAIDSKCCSDAMRTATLCSVTGLMALAEIPQ
jgi:hypothetical protein